MEKDLQVNNQYDLIIRGGSVYDGTGTEPRNVDIAITGETIAKIGDLTDAHSSIDIDATDLRIAPGFIDIHTHSDISALFNPKMESMVSQGVTTQVTGNCGLSLALATRDERFFFEKRWLRQFGVSITWDSLDENLRLVEENGIATNYLTLVGQGTLRKRVMGQDNRPPNAKEMQTMKTHLFHAMEEGAWGMSTGLEYTPSSYADVAELAELSEVVAHRNGLYASHLRNEGDTLIESVSEALEIGARAHIPVQISHHKSEGRRNWGKVKTTLEMISKARSNGVDVQLDQYPYTAFQTSMSVQFLPTWANVGDNDAVLARLTSPETRQSILDDIRRNHPEWDDLGENSVWDGVEIAMARTHRRLQGRTIGELARQSGANPIEYALDLITEERNFISAINFAINEEDIALVLQYPCTMIGSDAVGASPEGKMGEDHVHPRCYGTFPRVLGRYVRENNVISESAAIVKMTSLPASRLGIKKRGELKEGYYADIVIYDPKTIIDKATYRDPHKFADGVVTTIVNGGIVWKNGAHTERLPGMVLRKNRQ